MGISKTRLYDIFCGMKSRCYNPNNQHYKYYGAKGITVCDEWTGENGVQLFIEWALSNGYNENLTIDRINPEGDYSPNNCRWVTQSENSRNVQHGTNKSADHNTMALTMGEKIKVVMNRRNMTMGALADNLGQSRQNLSNKMSRDNFTEKEIKEIAVALDCSFEAVLIMNDTGEHI